MKKLRYAGLLTAVWNRTAEKAKTLAAELGCQAPETLAALASNVDAAVICVSADDDVLQIEPHHDYLINPGSVGQPRDMDPRSAYAIYTPETRMVEFRRVPYDVGGAAGKILEAGLPPSLAARLYEGT